MKYFWILFNTFWLVSCSNLINDLSDINLDKIILQRERLIAALNNKKNLLENDPPSNSNFNLKNAISLIDARIDRIQTLELVMKNSLDLFATIVQSKNIDELDTLMDKESNLIIDEFQKLVLRAKNDKLQSAETKKVEETQRVQGEFDQATVNSTLSDTETPHLVDNVLKDVAEKADSLENDLNKDTFGEGQMSEGATIETVIKVNKNDNERSKNDTSKSDPSAILIDSSNNQYVLSKPGDATAHVEDVGLLNDLLLLMLICFAFVFIIYMFRLPSFFGYILAGIVCSTNGFIKNAVQIETISRGLGVIFIMFFLGLEFNLTKIKRVWSISLFGTSIIFSITIALCIFIGIQFNASTSEVIVIAESIFLSSTAVVIHCLKPIELEYPYGRTIMGILVTQDVLLGFLLAMMPVLQSSGIQVAYTALSLLGRLIVFLFVCFLVRVPSLRALDWLVTFKDSNELFMMGSIGFCLSIIQIGQTLDQSMELACFVAGVLVASDKKLSEKVIHTLEPFKQLFGALFFASIGLHIYPQFLVNEGLLLIFLTTTIVGIKIIVTTGVMKVVFNQSFKTSFIISIGLAQISEFTFVLASKAKSADILSREAYFLLLGVTTLSIILSPLLWHMTFYLGRETTSDEREKFLETNADQVMTSFADSPNLYPNDSIQFDHKLD
ncbi:Sodium/hydrogen exchanger family-domain-containing protein [Globomyces pollinis-pini]|nr:Sodium/hydrogen exchanger family-domain-containing protein [Globomyces pollinis-pini]